MFQVLISILILFDQSNHSMNISWFNYFTSRLWKEPNCCAVTGAIIGAIGTKCAELAAFYTKRINLTCIALKGGRSSRVVLGPAIEGENKTYIALDFA